MSRQKGERRNYRSFYILNPIAGSAESRITLSKSWAPTQDRCWVPYVNVSFNTLEVVGRSRFYMEDSDPPERFITEMTSLASKQIVDDTTGTLSWVEDNLGNDWTVPPREQGSFFDIVVEVGNSGDPAAFVVEIWWEKGLVLAV